MNGDYVILTPAFNEVKYIGATIESVVVQTVRPALWVVVDDGSTDETSGVIKRYACKYPFIRYHHRVKPAGQAYFASNVHAIMEGYSLVRDLDFGYVAILDSDITLPQDYYERTLQYLGQDAKLGIASGIYENFVAGRLHKVLNDRRSAPKAIMVFRREVFEQIGGFLPLEYGGEDTVACIMARMKGWKTWSFPDIKVIHHRPTGTGNAKNMLRARYVQGLHEYTLGSHPLFVLCKMARLMVVDRPFVLGGMMRVLGYLVGAIRGERRQLPKAVVKYCRKEQIGRMLNRNRIPEELRPRSTQ